MLDTQPAHIPPAPAPLIGRDADLARVGSLLQRDDVRLLTLVGAPGVGKTRLASHIAAHLPADCADEAAFVGLEAVRDPELVPAAVVRSLGLREEAALPLLDTLRNHLRGRRLLLVLDNFEQVIPAAPVVGDLLRACPALKILVTSRIPLHLRTEVQIELDPLMLPSVSIASLERERAMERQRALSNESRPAADLAAVAASPAVELFLTRARTIRPSLALTPENAADVATICARLDGLPLAIELAAARVKLLSPREIAERLTSRLGLLTAGFRDAPARHQTLRAAIDWSYELLSPAEQRAFRTLGVFAAGGSYDAIEAVSGGSRQWAVGSREGAGSDPADTAGTTSPTAYSLLPTASPSTLDLLGALVDHSLARRTEDSDGTSRFRMLETIREYAVERLEAAGEAEAARLQLAGWFLAFAQLAGPGLSGPDQLAWLERLEVEHDNLRAVLRWTLDAGQAALGLELAERLWRFWHARSYLTEGREWLDRLLARGGSAPARMRAAVLFGAATLALEQGDFAGAAGYADQSLALQRDTGGPGLAEVLLLLGGLAYRRSDYAAARTHGEESLAFAETSDERRLAARCLNLLGNVAMDEGRFAEAGERFEAGLALARAVGDVRTSAILLSNLGLNAHRLDDFARSRTYLEQALALNRPLGHKAEIARTLTVLAMVARAMDDDQSALPFAREALSLAEETENRSAMASALNQLTPIARRLGDLAAARGYSVAHLRTAHAIGYPLQILAAVTEAAFNAQAAGRPATAVRLLAASEAQRERMGLAQHEGMRRTVEQHIEELRDQLDERGFAAAWAEGTAMSRDEAVAHALADAEAELLTSTPSTEPASSPAATSPSTVAISHGIAYPAGLTRRQVEILRLLAADSSNREIAERLVVTERTVEHHLANIYRRIEARGRVDATAYAHRHGLLAP